MGNILKQQLPLCLKAVQDWLSAVPLAIASRTPFGSLAPFRYSRNKLLEVGLNQQRFLGGKRKTVERTVLQAEEAQGILHVWAAAAVLFA